MQSADPNRQQQKEIPGWRLPRLLLPLLLLLQLPLLLLLLLPGELVAAPGKREEAYTAGE